MIKEFLSTVGLFLASLVGLSAETATAPPATPPAMIVQTAGPTEGLLAEVFQTGVSPEPGVLGTTTSTEATLTAAATDAITRAELDAALRSLRSEFLAITAAGMATAPAGTSGVSSEFFRLQVNRIYDSFDRGLVGVNDSFNTRINNLAAADVSGLNFLPLAGGTLSGDLTVAGATAFAGGVGIGPDAVAGVGADGAPYVSLLSVAGTFTDATAGAEPLSLNTTVNFSSGGGSVYAFPNYVRVPSSNTQNIGNLDGNYTLVQHSGSGNVTSITGITSIGRASGSGNVTDIVGIYPRVEHSGSGAVGTQQALRILSQITSSATAGASVASQYGIVLSSGTAKAGTTVTNNYGVWVGTPSHVGTIANNYSFFSNDLAGASANPYYSWFNSRGVGRCKEDNTFNSVGQSICVVYNPQFTKYTAGAADYERIVYGQWNSNVAEIGAEAGGTGTQRALRLLGSSVLIPSNLGVGTTTPWRKLSVAGTVGFDGLGSTGGTQTLCLTANKEVVTNNGECVSSSENLKEDIQTISLSAMGMVSAMRPVSFKYLDADRPTYGFIAEDVAAIDNRFIGYFDQLGSPRTINTASILAVTVKAVQELAGKVTQLAATVAGFAQSFFSSEITAGERLCVGSTCITETELQALLLDSGTSSAPPPIEPNVPSEDALADVDVADDENTVESDDNMASPPPIEVDPEGEPSTLLE